MDEDYEDPYYDDEYPDEESEFCPCGYFCMDCLGMCDYDFS